MEAIIIIVFLFLAAIIIATSLNSDNDTTTKKEVTVEFTNAPPPSGRNKFSFSIAGINYRCTLKDVGVSSVCSYLSQTTHTTQMKKILYTIVLLSVFVLDVFPQANQLLFDRSGNNSRSVGTYFTYISRRSMDMQPVGVALFADITYPDSINTAIALRFSQALEFPKDGVLLLKTGSGKVIELSQLLESHKTTKYEYLSSYGVNSYSIGLYPISVGDMLTISQEGISKLRIELSSSVYDGEYNKKRMQKFQSLFSDFINIVATLKAEKKDIRSDF
ncbi:MAG: hypothetical protein IJZ45_03940 [Bacteroidaceae bacterium]|nr:hypothetical protein [Bacteroidaceae bacterium]